MLFVTKTVELCKQHPPTSAVRWAQEPTGRAFSTLTSVCEHAYTCLHVSTETYQLIWMPAFTLDIYSC
jgi:hypothetical protein